MSAFGFNMPADELDEDTTATRSEREPSTPGRQGLYRRTTLRLAALCVPLAASIYLLEGCQTLERHHSIELTSSASSRTPYLVNGKRARVVFGYYLLIPEGRQRLTIHCPTGKIEQIVEVSGEQYLFYDCRDRTMSLL
ncbi:MAG TPA: hypothetical protein PLB31_07505 [Fimbriimonadaceae bacterium]|nr:hypothetical protein [Fimbriimonadaceae bacterium]HRE93732.1 hypothetical protein [Fimbriimonadaceae bacterium]HRI74303.1 hypothetical protein [Fimbriimonadaceae bacterium]